MLVLNFRSCDTQNSGFPVNSWVVTKKSESVPWCEIRQAPLSSLEINTPQTKSNLMCFVWILPWSTIRLQIREIITLIRHIYSAIWHLDDFSVIRHYWPFHFIQAFGTLRHSATFWYPLNRLDLWVVISHSLNLYCALWNLNKDKQRIWLLHFLSKNWCLGIVMKK